MTDKACVTFGLISSVPVPMTRPDSERLLIKRRCRETGLMVELWRNLDGIVGYDIICTDHAFNSHFDTRADAEAFLSHPKTEGWCEVCSGVHMNTDADQ